MSIKEYKVFFAKTTHGRGGSPIAAGLQEAVEQHGQNLPIVNLSNEKFQMRDLERVGRVWKGCFAKLRDDAPHVVAANEEERELELDDGERIIEKCLFLYRESSNIIVWQVNRNAGGLSRAQEYLAHVLDAYVSLPLVMNESELERILAGHVYQLDFAYARPASLAAQPAQWNQGAFDMMNSIDAAHAKFTLRASRGGWLAEAAKQMVRQLIPTQGVEKLRVKMTDESDPIELFMAPLKDAIRVELLGRYPAPNRVYEELEAAFGRQRDNIPNLN